MISAFGIVHKSMVGGGHYIPATKLTPGARNIIRNRLKPTGAANHNTRIPGKKVDGQSAKGRELYPDTGPVRSMARRISTDVQSQHIVIGGKLHPVLGHSQPNGKGGGVIRMNPNEPGQEETYKHELQHLIPKRNPHQFFERTKGDDIRSGREEGRADYLAYGKKTPGQYPGSKRFKQGYNEVQNKMHQNRKPRKFQVDREGKAKEVK